MSDEPKGAAGPWMDVRKEYPEPWRSYLVLTSGAGSVADVAFFNGHDKSGLREWLMADIRLNGVTHWAEIYLPGEDSD